MGLVIPPMPFPPSCCPLPTPNSSLALEDEDLWATPLHVHYMSVKGCKTRHNQPFSPFYLGVIGHKAVGAVYDVGGHVIWPSNEGGTPKLRV